MKFSAFLRGLKENDIHTCELFVLSKRDVLNKPAMDGNTPLIQTILYDNFRVMKMLVQKGADVNTPSNKGQTPLFIASWNNQPQFISFLLENGAKINQQDNNGWTPLMIAVFHNQVDAIKVLLSYGPDLSLHDKFGKKAIERANSLEVYNLFLENKSTGESQKKNESSPLESSKNKIIQNDLTALTNERKSTKLINKSQVKLGNSKEKRSNLKPQLTPHSKEISEKQSSKKDKAISKKQNALSKPLVLKGQEKRLEKEPTESSIYNKYKFNISNLSEEMQPVKQGSQSDSQRGFNNSKKFYLSKDTKDDYSGEYSGSGDSDRKGFDKSHELINELSEIKLRTEIAQMHTQQVESQNKKAVTGGYAHGYKYDTRNLSANLQEEQPSIHSSKREKARDLYKDMNRDMNKDLEGDLNRRMNSTQGHMKNKDEFTSFDSLKQHQSKVHHLLNQFQLQNPHQNPVSQKNQKPQKQENIHNPLKIHKTQKNKGQIIEKGEIIKKNVISGNLLKTEGELRRKEESPQKIKKNSIVLRKDMFDFLSIRLDTYHHTISNSLNSQIDKHLNQNFDKFEDVLRRNLELQIQDMSFELQNQFKLMALNMLASHCQDLHLHYNAQLIQNEIQNILHKAKIASENKKLNQKDGKKTRQKLKINPKPNIPSGSEARFSSSVGFKKTERLNTNEKFRITDKKLDLKGNSLQDLEDFDYFAVKLSENNVENSEEIVQFLKQKLEVHRNKMRHECERKVGNEVEIKFNHVENELKNEMEKTFLDLELRFKHEILGYIQQIFNASVLNEIQIKKDQMSSNLQNSLEQVNPSLSQRNEEEGRLELKEAAKTARAAFNEGKSFPNKKREDVDELRKQFHLHDFEEFERRKNTGEFEDSRDKSSEADYMRPTYSSLSKFKTNK